MKKPYVVATMIAAGIVAVGMYAQDSRSVWDGVYTDAQAKRGQPLYNDKCASCHSADLTGGESAPPLAGGQFMSNWEGLTAAQLFDRMKISMPQNKPGSLSGQENADILAYMFQVNGFPVGKTELAHQSEALGSIKLESQKK
jgi:S-disulfanyl-L-cysteine oxidoreductase SoxD